ncbi:hypothetical protein Tco_0747142 [Tanacetum coccineum]
MADEPLSIPLDEIQVDDKLHFIEEPIDIMDREIKRLKQSRIPIVKRYRSLYETSSSSSLTLPRQKRYRGTSELILYTNSNEDKLGDEDTKDDEEDESDEDHGLGDESQGLEDEGLSLEEEEAVPEGQQQAVLVVETATSKPIRLGYEALRRRELKVEEDQVPNTFEVGQSSRSVPEKEGIERIYAFRQPTLVTSVDPEDDRVYTNISAYAPPAAPVQTLPSPEWSLGSLPVSPSSFVVSSPIASPVATPTTIISVDEDQFIERPMLALEAWVGHVDTRLVDMSRDRYDDHRLIHDMLVQQDAMQYELQEMRGRCCFRAGEGP